MSGNCEDGQVRLVEGITDEENLWMDGRLEICINNAWGTICNNSFRVIDAQVACGQLIGFGTEGLCCCNNSTHAGNFLCAHFRGPDSSP